MTSAAPSTETDPIAPRTHLALDLFVGLASLVLLLTTSPVLPLVWDEANASERADQLQIWLELWVHREPGQAAPWETSAIRKYCPYTTVSEGHPDFYGFVIAFGRLASSEWLPPKESYRFGPIVLFAIATSLFFHRLRQQQGLVAAASGVVCLLMMPRLFAHAHFASIDGPLTACWIMTWATFDWSRRSPVGILIWGILLGLTMSCKFTGWLAMAPFLAWSLLYRDRNGWRVCLIGGIIAVVTFVNVNPMLWDHPIDGMRQFFSLNLHRADRGLNIPIQFFGTRYDMRHPLPWYNSLVWLVITVPVGALFLAALSGFRSTLSWRQHSPVVLLLIQAAVLVVVKAMPFAPPHDAERLFLPCFAFLAALAGTGAAWMLKSTGMTRWYRCAIVSLILISTSLETIWYTPQWLSYYSPVIGGLGGASRWGLEPTYYWDGLDHELITWLESQSGSKARVYLAASPEYARVMNRFSESQLQFSTMQPGECDWYLVQNRPGLWSAVDRQLINSQTPKFVKMIRNPAIGFGPWRLDVPLVFVFSREQWSQADSSPRS